MSVPFPALWRFVRYTAIGVSTLAFDLLLLAGLTQLFHVPYYIGTPIAFLIAVSLNYIISRGLVFAGTERPVAHGYVFFLVIALVGAAAVTGAVYLLVTYLHMYYLIARVLVAGVVGIANYLSNLHWNFRGRQALTINRGAKIPSICGISCGILVLRYGPVP
jgi:putative flippase GtrA